MNQYISEHVEKLLVDNQVNKWLRDGIVTHSNSDYASPIVIAPKKDGTKRICIDYRPLNQKIIKGRYPLPLIDNQIDALQGVKIYTTLDLKKTIKRTQFGSGLKIRPKNLGPYEVIKIKPNNRYDLIKIGIHEKSYNTSSSADNMQPWPEMSYQTFQIAMLQVANESIRNKQ